MSLSITLRVEARDVELELTVPAGETVAVMGPNGAGKSTVLEVAAGVVPADPGRVVVGGRDVTTVPTHRRGVGLLAQDPLLLPHLSVLDNVAFGPRSSGAGRRRSREVARTWLERVGLADLADRRPASLSGGQAQRVAIARALAAEPEVLLLDEPIAALDVTVVPEIRHLLRDVLADRTAVVVTHDVLDALSLADRVVVVEDGRLVEAGPTTDVLARPRSAFGARVAGLNLVRGLFHDGAVQASLVVVGESSEPIPEGAAAVAVFSPAAVAVHLRAPGGSPRNTWPATVRSLEPLGDRIRVRTDLVAADVTPSAVADLALAPGVEVVLAVKATEVALHPA